MSARYSPLAAKLLSVMILVFMTLNAASQMVGIGSFFGTYLGMNYEVAVLVGTGIVLIYSMFGGFRGVVLTDIIQFVLLAISALIVFIVAMVNSGGFDNIALAAEQVEKNRIYEFFRRSTEIYGLCNNLRWSMGYSGKCMAENFRCKERQRRKKNDRHELLCIYSTLSHGSVYRYGGNNTFR